MGALPCLLVLRRQRELLHRPRAAAPPHLKDHATGARKAPRGAPAPPRAPRLACKRPRGATSPWTQGDSSPCPAGGPEAAPAWSPPPAQRGSTPPKSSQEAFKRASTKAPCAPVALVAPSRARNGRRRGPQRAPGLPAWGSGSVAPPARCYTRLKVDLEASKRRFRARKEP